LARSEPLTAASRTGHLLRPFMLWALHRSEICIQFSIQKNAGTRESPQDSLSPISEHSTQPMLRPMPRRVAALAIVLVACTHASTPPLPQTGERYDVLVTNGRIVDGTGNAWFSGDVAIAGDRIARIAPPGRLPRDRARQVIDARGLVVAPGFIDIQGQSV